MSEPQELDLALRVLDQQLVDWSGRRCGKVDDIVIDGKPGERATVKALVLGRDSTRARRPRLLALIGRLAPTFGDAGEVEVPWSAVDEITHVIKLNEDAEALGIGRGDQRAEQWLRKLPRS
jgi:sporulation protein YlmC with PRC-barrel domain